MLYVLNIFNIDLIGTYADTAVVERAQFFSTLGQKNFCSGFMAFALPLVLCFVLLEQRRYLPAAVLYGVALAIKPQALLFGPVLAVCYLAAITLEKDRLRAFGRCFGGAALALLPPLLTGLSFFWRCAVDPEADRQIHRHNVRLPLRDDQRL